MQKKSKYTKELVLQACRNTKQERLEIQAAKNAVVVVVVIAVVGVGNGIVFMSRFLGTSGSIFCHLFGQ